MLIKLITDIISYIDKNYIIFILLNLLIICSTLLIILLTVPFLPFDNTMLLKSFNSNYGLLDSTNFGIMITSIALIPDLLFDIFHCYKGRSLELSLAALKRKEIISNKSNWLEYINTDKQFGMIILKTLIILGQGVPSSLLFIAHDNDHLQCIIYCSTTYIQNSFFATNILSAYAYSINQPKYYGICIAILLMFYGFANLLYTLRDFYFPLKDGHENESLEIIATIFSVSSYIAVFYALCQFLLFLYGRIIGRYSPFSSPRKYEIFIVTIIAFKVIIDNFYNIKEDRDEIPIHMVLVNLTVLFYLIILSNLYVHDHFDSVEASNDNLKVLSDQLSVEKSLLENFLYNVVPRKVVHNITNGEIIQPEYLKYACIFYAEVDGIDEYTASVEPMETFFLINRLFSVMDSCVDCFGTLTKVQSSENKYMVVAGLNYSQACSDDGEADDSRRDLLADIVEFSLLVSEAAQFVPMGGSNKNISLRIGLHSGDIAAGLTGKLTPRFSVFGNTVNKCRKLEETCQANKIQVSKEFACDLQSYSSFDINLSSLYRLEQCEQVDGSSLTSFWLLKSEHIKLKEKFSDEFDKINRIIGSSSKDVGVYVKPTKTFSVYSKSSFNDGKPYDVDKNQVSVTISETIDS